VAELAGLLASRDHGRLRHGVGFSGLLLAGSLHGSKNVCGWFQWLYGLHGKLLILVGFLVEGSNVLAVSLEVLLWLRGDVLPLRVIDALQVRSAPFAFATSSFLLLLIIMCCIVLPVRQSVGQGNQQTNPQSPVHVNVTAHGSHKRTSECLV